MIAASNPAATRTDLVRLPWLLQWIALGPVLGCICIVERLDFSRYRGDARVWERTQDDTYPKYWVLFPDIRIDRAGDYVFRSTGLPKSEYWFGLALDSMGSDTQREGVAKAWVHCNVEILGSPGEFIAELGGVLEEDPPVPLSSPNSRSYPGYWISDSHWIEGVRRRIYVPEQMGLPSNLFHADPRVDYVIRIRVKCGGRVEQGAGPPLPVMTPVMWAGGDTGNFFDYH
jgi:hypothetical protein